MADLFQASPYYFGLPPCKYDIYPVSGLRQNGRSEVKESYDAAVLRKGNVSDMNPSIVYVNTGGKWQKTQTPGVPFDFEDNVKIAVKMQVNEWLDKNKGHNWTFDPAEMRSPIVVLVGRPQEKDAAIKQVRK